MPNKVTLREIFDDDLQDVYYFLSSNYDPELKWDIWRSAFCRSWMPEKPNNGFMLVENQTIVGVLCALYSQQQTKKGIRNVCHNSTWFVLDTYRSHSLKLMVALLGQKGFFFTAMSVNQELYEIHRRFKFQSKVTNLIAIPNLPKLNYFSKRLEILVDPESISRSLDSHIKQISIDHTDIPTVQQIVFRTSNDTLLVIFDIRNVRGVPATNIFYLSNRDMFSQHRKEICSYFLLHNHTFFTRIHQCSMSKVPKFSLKIKHDVTFFYYGDITELSFPEFIYSEYIFFCR